MVNVVSRGVDVPPGLRGVGDLCRLGDQMLNIPPCQRRTGARHMKQNIIKRGVPPARVLHTHSPKTTEETLQPPRDPLKRSPRGELTTDWMTGLWRLTALHQARV